MSFTQIDLFSSPSFTPSAPLAPQSASSFVHVSKLLSRCGDRRDAEANAVYFLRILMQDSLRSLAKSKAPGPAIVLLKAVMGEIALKSGQRPAPLVCRDTVLTHARLREPQR